MREASGWASNRRNLESLDARSAFLTGSSGPAGLIRTTPLQSVVGRGEAEAYTNSIR